MDAKGDKEGYENQNKLISDIDDYLLSLSPPNSFNGDANILIHMDNSFEGLCASMEEAGISNPKKLTVFEFYSRIEYFQSKNKK